jgi:glycerol-3-phosphate dehydrogenase subunit B
VTSWDAVVIGGGLAGLAAALRVAEAGRRVLVVAKGVGGTHLAPATIDVLGYTPEPVDSPARALPAFAEARPGHPYAGLVPGLVAESLAWLRERVPELEYAGGLEENLLLPTAAGAAKPSALAPKTLAAGDLRRGGSFVFVGLRGLKDFYPAYLAENLTHAELTEPVSARGLELTLPGDGIEAGVGTLRFARQFEQPRFREAVVRALEGRIEPGERVGFPAVLGLRSAGGVWRELEERLERRVFEVPTMPPSVSGIRLYEALTARLRGAGGRLVLGTSAVGAETGGGRMTGVRVHTAAREVVHDARSVVLATGGFASGGFELDSHGSVRETVFGLPLAGVPARGEPRFLPGYFDEHPLSRVGLRVDALLRPVGSGDTPVYENLYAAGASLAGAVPWREASGNGISLATGYAAAKAVLDAAE